MRGSPPSAIRLALTMCIAEALSMTGVATYTTLLPLLQREWTLSNSEAGLIGGAFWAGYMAGVPLLAGLTDRIDARRVYVCACAMATAGSAAFALFAQGLWTALVLQFFVGAGLAGSYMPGLKLLTDQLEGTVQSRATAFYTASFGVGTTISIFASGQLAPAFGWVAAFVFAASGPVLAAVLVLAIMPPGRIARTVRPEPGEGRTPSRAPPLLDFRSVLSNRTTRAYIAGYCVHSYELFAQRAWMVAFLVYCASLQPAHLPMLASAATLAAFINLIGPIMSVSGNELAHRFGRERVIFTFMGASGLMACVLGYTASLPWWIVFLLMMIHSALMLGDSAALTAGAVGSAPPERRGSTMAVYSFLGFSSAFFAPLAFGVVLDLAGGNRSTLAWGLAFASIGIFGALAPMARWYATRTR